MPEPVLLVDEVSAGEAVVRGLVAVRGVASAGAGLLEPVASDRAEVAGAAARSAEAPVEAALGVVLAEAAVRDEVVRRLRGAVARRGASDCGLAAAERPRPRAAALVVAPVVPVAVVEDWPDDTASLGVLGSLGSLAEGASCFRDGRASLSAATSFFLSFLILPDFPISPSEINLN